MQLSHSLDRDGARQTLLDALKTKKDREVSRNLAAEQQSLLAAGGSGDSGSSGNGASPWNNAIKEAARKQGLDPVEAERLYILATDKLRVGYKRDDNNGSGSMASLPQLPPSPAPGQREEVILVMAYVYGKTLVRAQPGETKESWRKRQDDFLVRCREHNFPFMHIRRLGLGAHTIASLVERHDRLAGPGYVPGWTENDVSSQWLGLLALLVFNAQSVLTLSDWLLYQIEILLRMVQFWLKKEQWDVVHHRKWSFGKLATGMKKLGGSRAFTDEDVREKFWELVEELVPGESH